MSRSTAAIITAGFAVVAGLVTAVLSGATLSRQGVWGPNGIARGHLDFTAAALLLVGLALLLMGLILLLATLADYWMEGQDRRDAAYEASQQRLETERYRLAASLAETRPDLPRPLPDSRRRIAH